MTPVLYQEMLLGSRRNRQYVFRWIYAGLLLVELGLTLFIYLVTLTASAGNRLPSYTEFAATSRYIVELLAGQHFTLLLLVTPTVTAGAITDEKSRGTLQYLLTAELQPGEIILGKVIGRSYQIALLMLTALPPLAFFGVYAGLDWVKLLAFVAATVVMIFALASASLLASVLCRHTRDAVLSLYSIGVGLVVLSVVVHAALEMTRGAGPVSASPGWLRTTAAVLEAFNPLAPLGPEWMAAGTGETVRRLGTLLLTWGLFGCGCLVVAVLRLRGAYLRHLQGATPKKRRWWRAWRPQVRNDPLAWKERHVEGIAPLALLRGLPSWLGLVLVVVITTGWAGYLVLRNMVGETIGTLSRRVAAGDWQGLVRVQQALPGPNVAHDFYWYFGLPVMLVASLVVGIRCSGAVTGEREKQTWEALLLTPLETRQLIRGKFWGICGATWPYLLAYAVPALGVSAIGGVAACLWTLLWLGVTILAMAFVGAAGLWCSVYSASSWRSLLGTLAFAYGGGLVMFCVASPVLFFLFIVFFMMLMVLDGLMGTGMAGAAATARASDSFGLATCVCLAAIFVFAAWQFVVRAEYRVGVLERTKHWRNEPRSRRRPPSLARPAPRRYDDYSDGY
jgi:ABC-type transport system involved in multi-copper enzyme maturation permease subunit